jgi:hypothetical protein
MEIEKIYEYKKMITAKHFTEKQTNLNKKKKSLTRETRKDQKAREKRRRKRRRAKEKAKNNPTAMIQPPPPPKQTMPEMVGDEFDMHSFMMEGIKNIPKRKEPETGVVKSSINPLVVLADEPDSDPESESEFDSESDSEDYEKSTRKGARKHDMEIGTINTEIAYIIKEINDENKSDVLRLSDLLELFQGPVPIKDRMIIATTNNYQNIKDTLPALFRAGRLTPLRFDNLDWQSFCELCQYYFKALPTEEFDITMCTSGIIELVEKYPNPEDFEEFIRAVRQ